ncbi:MAG: GtrA family protein [Clostridia bacterium]|nr:GtrA family protein [Clostridia bacterium]
MDPQHNRKKTGRELLRTIKYALVAASAGVIQIGTFTLLNELLHWDYWVSYLIALVLSVLWNFTLNRRYTFQSASDVKKAMLLVFLYYLVFTPLSTWLEDFLADTCGWNEYLVTGSNMLINFVTEFLYPRFFVFRDTLDTTDLAEKKRRADRAS